MLPLKKLLIAGQFGFESYTLRPDVCTPQHYLYSLQYWLHFLLIQLPERKQIELVKQYIFFYRQN